MKKHNSLTGQLTPSQPALQNIPINTELGKQVRAALLGTPQPRKIMVAICVDPMGCGAKTPEEEVEEHKQVMQELLRPHKLSFYQAHHAGACEEGIRPGTNLIVFDFGGMIFGNSLAQTNGRELVRWCQDNPSGLVLVMTSFTYQNAVQDELDAEDLGSLHNLKNFSEDQTIPEWFIKGT